MNKNLEKVFYGKEPEKTEYSKLELIEAYNYFNYMEDKDKSKNWLMNYLYESELITNRHILKDDFPLNLGWIARLLSKNCIIPKESTIFFSRTWPKYVVLPEEVDFPKDKDTKLFSKSCLIADVEDVLDIFYKDDYKKSVTDFNDFFKSRNATQISVIEIKEYYTPLLQEIDLKDYNPKLSKQQKNNYKEFLENLIKACDFYLNNKQQERKPRKVKPKPADKLIKKLSYKVDDKELSMVSINPIKLVGSKTVIL